MLDWVLRCIKSLPASVPSYAAQHDAQTDNGEKSVMVSTDPPYYDNIGYAELSDYFYVWLRQSLKTMYPDLFSTLLVPKSEELIATPFRFDGDINAARNFFEKGMEKAFRQTSKYVRRDMPITIYYAFKQSETDEDDDNDEVKSASTGWETMLTATVSAGLASRNMAIKYGNGNKGKEY
jgi:putative DNA methylase